MRRLRRLQVHVYNWKRECGRMADASGGLPFEADETREE
jgi:hypothetical protein